MLHLDKDDAPIHLYKDNARIHPYINNAMVPGRRCYGLELQSS